MKWMNHNKTRVMDFFRRQDRDHDGKVTREEFIQGILASSKWLHQSQLFSFVLIILTLFLLSYGCTIVI